MDYSEFLRATLNLKQLVNIELIKSAFDVFDRDNNGYIISSELKEVLGGNSASEDCVWNKLIGELDKNGDGKVDFEEFSQMIRNSFGK